MWAMFEESIMREMRDLVFQDIVGELVERDKDLVNFEIWIDFVKLF